MHLSEIWHSKKNDSRLSRTQVIRYSEKVELQIRFYNAIVVKRFFENRKIKKKQFVIV